MTAAHRPIVVGIGGSESDGLAVEWAIDEARRSKSPLRLVYAYQWPIAYGNEPLLGRAPALELTGPQSVARAARDIMDRAVGRVRELAPDVHVDEFVTEGHAVTVLEDESTRAVLVVLGSRQLAGFGSSVLGSVSAATAARASCPVVVVRGPAGSAAELPSVVVGIDGRDDPAHLLAFGFEHASRHAVPLRAVLCWHPDRLATMMWRSEPSAPPEADELVSEALAGWREKYPDVAVRGGVIREHPTAGLVAQSHGQHMLVVGRHGRHALVGTLLGSTSQGVLHHATCPVAVVSNHD